MAWFICPYKWVIDLGFEQHVRRCAMVDYTEQLRVDAGRPPLPVEDHGGYPAGESPLWAECEFLGDRAIVKVHSVATETVLAVIEAGQGFLRIPAEVLDIALEDQNITNQDLRAMWNAMQDAGYTVEDVQTQLGITSWQELGGRNLRQLLRTFTSRWRRPKGWNLQTDEPEFETEDWVGGAPSSIEAIDSRIP